MNTSLKDTRIKRWNKVKYLFIDRKRLPPSHAGLSRAHRGLARLHCAHRPVPDPSLLRGSRDPGPAPRSGPPARALPKARGALRCHPRPARVMDGSRAGCLSGLIDEVCADSRRVALGGRRRARGGGQAGADSAALGVSPRPAAPATAMRPRRASRRGWWGAEAHPGPGARAQAPLPPAAARLPSGPPMQPCTSLEPVPLLPSLLSCAPVLRSYPGGPERSRRPRL